MYTYEEAREVARAQGMNYANPVAVLQLLDDSRGVLVGFNVSLGPDNFPARPYHWACASAFADVPIGTVVERPLRDWCAAAGH